MNYFLIRFYQLTLLSFTSTQGLAAGYPNLVSAVHLRNSLTLTRQDSLAVEDAPPIAQSITPSASSG